MFMLNDLRLQLVIHPTMVLKSQKNKNLFIYCLMKNMADTSQNVFLYDQIHDQQLQTKLEVKVKFKRLCFCLFVTKSLKILYYLSIPNQCITSNW